MSDHTRSAGEVRDHHSRAAARLRALAENATTPKLRARLLEEAEREERLAGLS
jgi:hypothetical protein